MTTADHSLPLCDVKVIDLTVARAGPTAVRQLADWGADVVRIEPPESTAASSVGLGRNDPDFLNLHRNKRCMTLDLKREEGIAVLHRLVRGADVLVENFRAGVKHRLGIDYASLRPLNPRLVYGSISGFGQDGPYAQRAGVDQIAQGMGGLMSITGRPGDGPLRVGIPISDLAAGMQLAYGILLALYERQRSGEGQWVHTSLLEAQIAMLDFQAARWLIGGEIPAQNGNDHPTLAPMGVFATADGHVNVAGSSDKMFTKLCSVLDAQELLERPEYATPKERSEHRAELNQALEERTRLRPSSHWVEALNAVGVPCGPIYTIDQTFADPQVQHLGIAQPVEHPRLGTLRVVGQPLHLTRTPTRVRSPAPERGEHSDEILRELGYDAEQVAELHEHGII